MKCIKKSCPLGQNLRKGKCVKIVCLAGMKLDTSFKCQSICNLTDEKFDAKLKVCMKTKCDDGYNLTNGKCVLIVCKAGYALDITFDCVSICNLTDEKWDAKLKVCMKTKCDAGFKLTNGKCVKIVCQAGYELAEENNKCESICNPKDEKWDAKNMKCIKKSCPLGQNLRKGKCVKIVCLAGMKLDTSFKCQSICNLTDEKWDPKSKTCLKTKCDDGYNLTNGKCVLIVCQAGYALDITFDCVSICDLTDEKWDASYKTKTWLVSTINIKLINGKCVKIVCKEGTELAEENNKCESICNPVDEKWDIINKRCKKSKCAA